MKNNMIVIGDPHFGVSDGCPAVLDFQIERFRNAIDYCLINNIKTITILGDLFDTKKTIDVNVAHQIKRKIFDMLQQYGIHVIVLLGNHDLRYANSTDISSVEIILDKYDNVTIIKTPRVVNVQGVDVLYIPWICKDNEAECYKAIRSTNVKICCGHFEVKGCRMESGVCEKGMDLSEFANFSLVCSGHFHTRGEYGNLQYVGTLYDLTWGGYGGKYGFGIVDLDSSSLHYMTFDDKGLHIKIHYNEEYNMMRMIEALPIKNRRIHVIVENRSDMKKYDQFIDKLCSMQPLKLIKSEPQLSRNVDDNIVERVGNDKSTLDLFMEYIDVNHDSNNELKRYVTGLYNESNT